MLNKNIPLNQIESMIENLKKQGKKIIFTNGCFDIIHAGHVIYLQDAKKLGDILVLGLNSDKSIKKIKGEKRPILSETDRIIIISAFEFIDYIVLFDEETPLNLITKVKPDIHVKGGDYKAETLPEYPLVKSLGGDIKIIPFIPGKSTTSVIEKILHKYK